MQIAMGPKKRPAKQEELEIERVSIEQAGNGFMVSTHVRPKKELRGRCDLMWPEPQKMVFTDVAKMADHIAGIFGAKQA